MLAKVAMFEMLRARGVRHVFGNPGTTELNFMEMFADYPDIQYVLALQDAIPVGMAYGYAQATGQPAFVNLHITPGVANGLGNIFNAYRAKVPLVVTAGQVDTRMILQEPSLWSDLARLASPFTKWSYEARAPEDVPPALARAFKTAAAAPAGPVFLGLPMDCLDGEVPGPAPWFELETETHPAPAVIERIATALAEARDPVLVVGGGAATARARTALVRIAEAIGARVYGERLPTRSAFPTDHPQYLGMAGLALPELQAELGAADVVVLAGARKFAGLLYTPPVNLAARPTGISVSSSTNITTTLTSGSCWPSRIAPKIHSGSVFWAPAVKVVTITSSNESAKASRAPESSAVDSIGTVIVLNVNQPWAPRSADASYSEPETRRSRAITLL